MSYKIQTEEGVRIVEPVGELDHHKGGPALDDTLTELRKLQGCKVVLNLRAVTYVCSSAVAVIVNFCEHIKGLGGELVCCEMSTAASEIMDLLEIPEVIRCFKTQREAIDAVKKGPSTRTRPVAS